LLRFFASLASKISISTNAFSKLYKKLRLASLNPKSTKS